MSKDCDEPFDVHRRPLRTLIFTLFLAFPVVDLVSSDPSTPRLLAGLGGAVLFVGLFTLQLRRNLRQDLRDLPTGRQLAGLALLYAIATPMTLADRPSWALLYIFVASSAGMRLPPRLAVAMVAFVAVSCGAACALGGGDGSTALSLAVSTISSGLVTGGFRHLLVVNGELRDARAELAERAVGEERLRFARDLHDLLGHSLSVIALKAELAKRLLPDRPEQAAMEVGDVERVARDALVDVRRTVSGYHSPTLGEELAGARIALDAAGIEATVSSVELELEPAAEALLAWTVREGTTNVIRHSGAHRVRIGLQALDGEHAELELADDGRGTVDGDRGGHGLRGLRERAAPLGGSVEAGPLPDGGGYRLRTRVALR